MLKTDGDKRLQYGVWWDIKLTKSLSFMLSKAEPKKIGFKFMQGDKQNLINLLRIAARHLEVAKPISECSSPDCNKLVLEELSNDGKD